MRTTLARMVREHGRDEAIKTLCVVYGISVQHAEEILANLDKYQYFEQHTPKLDAVVAENLKTEKKVAAVKAVREFSGFGLFEAKMYVEDIEFNLKPWPKRQNGY